MYIDRGVCEFLCDCLCEGVLVSGCEYESVCEGRWIKITIDRDLKVQFNTEMLGVSHIQN